MTPTKAGFWALTAFFATAVLSWKCGALDEIEEDIVMVNLPITTDEEDQGILVSPVFESQKDTEESQGNTSENLINQHTAAETTEGGAGNTQELRNTGVQSAATVEDTQGDNEPPKSKTRLIYLHPILMVIDQIGNGVSILYEWFKNIK